MKNNLGSKTAGVFVFFFTVLTQAFAQDKITLRDAKEISYQAQATVQGYQGLLNYITFSGILTSELNDAIANSYSSSRTRVFSDKDVVIEDDINPQSSTGKTKDAKVEKYLNDLYLQYQRTNDATITFSNIYVSGIKKKGYVYVNVRFDSNFGSKYLPNGNTYSVRQREALVKMESTGNGKWQALIAGIHFYNPANPTEAKDNDLQITTDTTSTASVVSQEELSKEIEKANLARQEEEKRNQVKFDGLIAVGDDYFANKQFKEALDIYGKADELKPLEPKLYKKIVDTKKLISENTPENYQNKANKAKNERNFTDAIRYYNMAIALKPELSSVLQPEITALTQKSAIVLLPNNKLQSGDLQGAIDACEKVLRENKKEKNNYPELYYIEGAAYQAIAENKADDKRNLEKAIANYNIAIQLFPNYKDARLARAAFYVKHRNDYNSALTDYDVLTTNELDDSADKPQYFIAKAKLKDKVGNSNGALADYDRAISLNPTTALFYYNKGELQYRKNNFNDAAKSFDMAVKTDPKYALAYYYRGLNYVKLKKNSLAGSDFEAAEKSGLELALLETVKSISNDFFVKAKALADSHNFSDADSLYDDALKIRNCNADAWHGKAEIRLIKGDELTEKKSFADAVTNYNQSIAFNKKAIECNAKFSDAYFKEGLAQNKIKEYAFAVNSFTEAIKNDNNSVQAYIERGNTYQIQEKYARAVEDYNSAIVIFQANSEAAKKNNNKDEVKNINNNLSKAFQLCGQAQYNLADYTNALNSLNKAIDNNKINSEAFYYRGLVYYSQNELSKSSKDLDQSLKLSPKARYYYANGKTYLKNKNYPTAVNNFTEAIKTDSSNSIKNKYYFRGLSYFKNKQINEAISDFDTYSKTESSKTDSLFYADYGIAQLFTNQDSAAVKSFNQALTLSSGNNGKALFGLACVYAKSGKFDKVPDLVKKAFTTHQLTKDEIKTEEESFLTEFNKVKANRSKYNELKKTLLTSN